jgi:heme exporter protein D
MDHLTFAQLLGNYGEFVGAIAVVLTLVYLIFQVMQNTKAIRQQSYNDILQRRNQWFRDPAVDRQVMSLFGTGVEGEQFDELDAARFTFLMVNYYSHVQDCYMQYRAGIVERSVWEAEVRIIIASFRRPGSQAWWRVGKQFFVPEFVDALERETEAVGLVFYDPKTSTWFTGGEFPTDAKQKHDSAYV